MNQALSIAPQSAAELVIRILSGPDKGSEYKILTRQVRIGRDPDNDIVIQKDSKCSRKHALLTVEGPTIWITNITEKNKVLVNGKPVKKAALKNKDLILVGKTKIQFIIRQPSPSVLPSHREIGKQTPGTPFKSSSLPHPAKQKKKKLFPILIVLLVIALLSLLSTSKKQKQKTAEFKTKEEVELLVQKEKERLRKLKEERIKSGKNSIQYKKAQTYYLKGFRDYKKGQYERALNSFSNCLSIFPSHFLCLKY
ncbi:MAG: FHA domain-containing protein, partial [Bdellovibrio sp.]